jgi:hypothetical protein
MQLGEFLPRAEFQRIVDVTPLVDEVTAVPRVNEENFQT